MNHPVNVKHHEARTLGERIADDVATGMGSWKFIIIQSAVVAVWITLNLIELFGHRWDPYPFILLNLLFSLQAAYAAPVIMMSQNRASAKDRDILEHTYQDSEEHRTLLRQNTDLTQQSKDQMDLIHQLTKEVHEHIINQG